MESRPDSVLALDDAAAFLRPEFAIDVAVAW